MDELAKKTHCDMLQALKEISVPVDDPVKPSTPPAPGVTETQKDGREKVLVEAVRAQQGQVLLETGPRQRTISVASEETEDEGAVLVRRP